MIGLEIALLENILAEVNNENRHLSGKASEIAKRNMEQKKRLLMRTIERLVEIRENEKEGKYGN